MIKLINTFICVGYCGIETTKSISLTIHIQVLYLLGVAAFLLFPQEALAHVTPLILLQLMERGREGGREREREGDRQTDRQTDR